MPPGEYDYVMLRDGRCVAAQIDVDHRCEGKETLDHVPGKNENALGQRAPSDRRHLLRLCWGANVNGWASANRDRERAWIASMEDLDDEVR
jgi:hypothetical protein